MKNITPTAGAGRWWLTALLLSCGAFAATTASLPLTASFPANNPPTPEKVALGRALFYDPLLSQDGKVACATCHVQSKGFTDGAAISTGSSGRTGKRSAPSLVNVAFRSKLFWHGGSPNLELQILGPLTDHNEHALTVDEIVAKLRTSPTYSAHFQKVFGRAPDMTALTQAIASFERTIISYNSAFDRYSAGNADAMTTSQVRGMDLFYDKAECFHCHNGRNFSDNLPHNNASLLFNEDIGAAQLTDANEDVGKFITPTLRNVGLTAPYMHAGQMATLEEVVSHYNAGGQPNPNADPLIRPLGLSAQEEADLVAFLKALTDPTVATNPAFGPPAKENP